MVPNKQTAWLTGAQLRAARSLIGMTAAELAEASGVGLRTIMRAEKGEGLVQLMDANVERLVRTLEAKGIVFIKPNGGGPGVRLASPPTGRPTLAKPATKRKKKT